MEEMPPPRKLRYDNSWCFKPNNWLKQPTKGGTLRENWSHWIESFESYGILDELEDRPKRMQFEFFWSALGAYGQDLARSVRIEPKEVKIEEEEDADDVLSRFKTAITNRVEGTVSTIGIEQSLMSMSPNTDEDHNEFIQWMKKKAKDCMFGAGKCCQQKVWDRIIVLRMVMGGNNRLAARECTLKPDITLDDPIIIYNAATNSDRILAKKPETYDVRAASYHRYDCNDN
jgi:hypothetical protein